MSVAFTVQNKCHFPVATETKLQMSALLIYFSVSIHLGQDVKKFLVTTDQHLCSLCFQNILESRCLNICMIISLKLIHCIQTNLVSNLLHCCCTAGTLHDTISQALTIMKSILESSLIWQRTLRYCESFDPTQELELYKVRETPLYLFKNFLSNR